MSGYYLISARNSGERWDDDVWTDERWDDDTADGGDESDIGGAGALPPFLAGMPEWLAPYGAGYGIADAVRLSLDDDSLPDDEAHAVLSETLAAMSPDEAENFLRSLGRVAQAALPVVGGAVGSIIAPGVGTALGGALGQAAGGLVGKATQGAVRTRPATRGRPMGRTAPQRRGGAGGSAVSALMAMLNNPQLLGAVANAAMGGSGKAAGGAAFGSLMSALRGLAGEAAAEMHVSYANESLDETDDEASAAMLVRIVGALAPAGVQGSAL